LGVCRVPYQVFTDQALYDLEQQSIFRGDTWHWVGLEAETPNAGDFKTNYIGDTPVVIIRDAQTMKVFVNRCAHRGTTLCIDSRGNKSNFTCIYHNWSYDLDGNLQGVAFRHGVRGQGGLPPDFDFAAHHLHRLRVEVLNGLVFATFSAHVAPLRAWLGERMTQHIERLFSRPVRLLGSYTQYMHNNWKLYVENVKDAYHASLLHLFFTTFKLNRLSMEGAVDVSDSGGVSSLGLTADGCPSLNICIVPSKANGRSKRNSGTGTGSGEVNDCMINPPSPTATAAHRSSG
jgi:anthranilate 1,2-dioxygenase large subunit/terephthalate 1,2-dioxygenase oxygenase component alpha subunit